jgi:hypothetical protein
MNRFCITFTQPSRRKNSDGQKIPDQARMKILLIWNYPAKKWTCLIQFYRMLIKKAF